MEDTTSTVSPSDANSSSGSYRPYVSPSKSLPEITIKAVILGALLSVVLAGANAYLGLLAGMTVSASIPAAVISMSVLRLFRRSNILENNIVQTAASAGESLAAGVIFTFPALIILKVWTDFNYWQTTLIAGLGGLIGVLFTIPLRRALVVDSPLKFPEGVATAEVLKVGDGKGAGIGALVAGSLIGALFKVGETGLRLWSQSVEGAWRMGSSVAYVGSNLLPSLVAVGYIVGFNIAVLIFLGGALNWFVAIPTYAGMNSWPADTGAFDYAWQIWSTQTRFLGVGAMVVGGLYTLTRLSGRLIGGIASGLRAYRESKSSPENQLIRTERDAPMQWVMGTLAVAIVPLFLVFNSVTGNVGIASFMAVVMLVAGFLFSAVAAYMAGLVGSSNNPISGVTIATLLTAALLLFFLVGKESAVGPAAAILIGAVVCCAAAIGGDNMQDLKAGHLLGATPYKQQIMQTVGVVVAAFVVAPILSLLLHAYGIVEPASPERDALAAPQATLMASIAKGVFDQNLPWTMVIAGMVMAIGIIGIDVVLERRGSSFRTPVLAVAVGIYLPLELETPILVGGLIAWMAHRIRLPDVKSSSASRASRIPTSGEGSGLLFAAGLITGEALLGILLAIPIVLFEGRNPIDLSHGHEPAAWPGMIILIAVILLLYRIARKHVIRAG